jgi:hypothetical protein
MKRRLGRRGAAMVEGVIVMSVFVVFSGLIVYMRKAYGAKLDMQQNTRSATLYYASHGCEGDPGGANGMGTGGAVPVQGAEADAAAGKSNIPDRAAVNRSFNTASTEVTGTVSWQAVWDHGKTGAIEYRKETLTSNIKASSSTTCNEKKYDSQWTAWFQFGVDFFKTGGGGVDLFR